ncbi:OR1E1 protein, partial [Polypterus senegalus]
MVGDSMEDRASGILGVDCSTLNVREELGTIRQPTKDPAGAKEVQSEHHGEEPEVEECWEGGVRDDGTADVREDGGGRAEVDVLRKRSYGGASLVLENKGERRSDSPGMNQTSVPVSEFVLDCTVESQKKSYAIAILTLVYLVTLFGNFLVVLVIALNPQLQKPMYVGIAALAVIDLVGSTNFIPTLIAVFSGWAAIPYGVCLIQLLIALYLGAAQSYLLVFMACDRYVAVLHPLRYSTLATTTTIWVAGKRWRLLKRKTGSEVNGGLLSLVRANEEVTSQGPESAKSPSIGSVPEVMSRGPGGISCEWSAGKGEKESVHSATSRRSDSPGMNQTSVSISEFVLLCTIDAQKKSYTVAILIMVYLVTLFGNILVILVIAMNPQLQKPMYVGIATLAVIDLVGSTNIIPQLIAILSGWAAVPYGPCLLQLLLVLYLAGAESFLLVLMACDRYVAVVHPLRYSTLVTRRAVWAAGLFLNIFPAAFVLIEWIFITELSFCNTNIINYCFCVYSSLVKIACNENPKYLDILSAASFVFGICPFAFILLSYVRIAYAALKISSNEGKKKTLNTLTTHLLVVGLSNIPLLFYTMLTRIGVRLNTEANNTMIIVAIIVPPMFNPIIYSFRNKEMRSSIQKLFKRT